jgi:hypothetical protein
VAKQRLTRLVIHLSLEFMPVLERHRALRRRARADFVDQPLQIWELRPRGFAEHGRDQARPAPHIHIDDRVSVAEHVFLLGEPCVENAEVTLRLEGITVNRIFDLVRSKIAEVHRLAGIRADTGCHEHQPRQQLTARLVALRRQKLPGRDDYAPCFDT